MSVYYKPHHARTDLLFVDHESYRKNQKRIGTIRSRGFTAVTTDSCVTWTVEIHPRGTSKTVLHTLTGTPEQHWDEVVAEAAEATRVRK